MILTIISFYLIRLSHLKLQEMSKHLFEILVKRKGFGKKKSFSYDLCAGEVFYLEIS